MTKIHSVPQEPTDSAAAFLERLIKASIACPPINLEVTVNKSGVILAFVHQATPDIRKKLQKIDGFAGKSLSKLQEVAARGYNNRETPEERQARLRTEENKRQEKIRAAENEK